MRVPKKYTRDIESFAKRKIASYESLLEGEIINQKVTASMLAKKQFCRLEINLCHCQDC